MENLRGLVLSGGESRRMGQDKGLLESDSVAWMNRAGLWLQEVGLPVSVMIRDAQREAYTATILPEFELLSDLELDVHGPLRGLLSFHRVYPQSDVLVLPCDMPNISAEILSGFLLAYKSLPQYDIWAVEVAERLQPFPGIYAASHLARIWQQLEKSTLPKSSLMYVLESGKVARIGASEAFGAIYFLNVNRPEDVPPLS